MLETLNDIQIDKFLKEQTIGRIGCHVDGKTYVVPTSYVYDGKFIYCHAHEGMKINMMRKNPKICFEVDAFKVSATWESVIVWGDFIEVTDEQERNNILQILISNKLPIINSVAMKMELGINYPYPPDNLSTINGIIFKIEINEKTGRQEVFENNYEFMAG